MGRVEAELAGDGRVVAEHAGEGWLGAELAQQEWGRWMARWFPKSGEFGIWIERS